MSVSNYGGAILLAHKAEIDLLSAEVDRLKKLNQEIQFCYDARNERITELKEELTKLRAELKDALYFIDEAETIILRSAADEGIWLRDADKFLSKHKELIKGEV
jgi:uncharacterized coiled-coil DUF342 family protein